MADETGPAIEVIEHADDTICSGRPGCKSNRITQHTGAPWVCPACESGSNSPLAVFASAPPIGGGKIITPR